METSLVGGELGGDFLRSLNYPEVEDFGLVEKMVVVANPFTELGCGVAGIAGNDAVHKGGVDAASGLEPVAELFTELPKVYILAYAFLEVLAVFENQLAGENDEALALVAAEMFEAVVKELGEFAGI